MILISGAPYIPLEAKAILGAVTYETSKAYMEPLHPGGEEQIKMLLTQMRNLANNYDDVNFTPPYLATIKCPTFIIHGDKDPILPIQMPINSYTAIPHSYLFVVPNSGHFPAGVYSKDSIWSDVLFKLIEEFLGGKWK
jgi:pimeloyl-ACP methyl ester carboxylesterase